MIEYAKANIESNRRVIEGLENFKWRIRESIDNTATEDRRNFNGD